MNNVSDDAKGVNADLLDTLYTVKFTLESVKPSTTVGELLDLWHEVNAAIAKAEGR